MALGIALKLASFLQPLKKLTAVIIKGDPKFITNNTKADKFYSDLTGYLRFKGYDVSTFNAVHWKDEVHIPPPADLWVGHSQGTNRLRFAPKGTKTLMFGSYRDGAINHHLDNQTVRGVAPSDYHYILTDEMKNAIDGITKQAANVLESVGKTIRHTKFPHIQGEVYQPALELGRSGGRFHRASDPHDSFMDACHEYEKVHLKRAPNDYRNNVKESMSKITKKSSPLSLLDGEGVENLWKANSKPLIVVRHNPTGNVFYNPRQAVTPMGHEDIMNLHGLPVNECERLFLLPGESTLSDRGKFTAWLRASRGYNAPTPAQSADLFSKAAEDAKGIPDRKDLGDLSKLEPGKLYDMVVQNHQSKNPHNDIRIGNKELGLFSFATQKKFPLQDKEKIEVFQQPVHSYEYKDWEGEIPKGEYGAGTVTKQQENKILVTRVTPQLISFSLADKTHPERYSLIKLKNMADWLLMKHAPVKETGHTKVKYTAVPKEEMFSYLKDLKEGDIVQPKIDGALSVVLLNGGKSIETMSHRISKKNDLPITHSERFIRERIKAPHEHRDSTLLGEMYGIQKGQVIHPSTLAGILNSTIANSINTQDKEKIKLRTSLFDITRYRGKPVTAPYSERLKLLKQIVKELPKDKFVVPETTSDKAEAIKMLKSIIAKKHPLTSEGVVIHHAEGNPSKIKTIEDHDVVIRKIYPGEDKYSGKAAGGIEYSWTKDGPIVGRCGTGMSDEERIDMHKNPDKYIGRVAVLSALEKNKSGILQKPSFISLHESK